MGVAMGAAAGPRSARERTGLAEPSGVGGPRCSGRRGVVGCGAGAGPGTRTPPRSIEPLSRPAVSCGPGSWRRGCGAGGATSLPQAPCAPGMRSRSSSSAGFSEGSRKVYAPGAGTPGCSTMPAFSGSPSPGTWPVSVMRTPRPSVSASKSCSPGTAHRPPRSEERACVPSGTNDRPTKTTKPLTGIVPVVRPSRQLDPRRPAVDCATLRVLRFCRTTHSSKRARFPDIGPRKADHPGAVQRSASLPRAVRQQDHGLRSGRRPVSRNATLRSVSVQALVSSSTD